MVNFIFLILFSLNLQAAYINQVQVTNFPATQAVSQSGTWTVQQGTPPWTFSLPTGASTSSNQTTANNLLSSIDGKIPASLTVTSSRLLIDGSGVTQPVSGTVTANLGTIAGVATESTLSSLNSKVTAVNTGAVVVSSSALPSGASTSANQTTANSSLSSIDSKTPELVSGRQPVDGSGVTQPISAASLPLPSGAATSANQTTANASLSSIDTKVATAANQSTANASLSSINSKLTSPIGVYNTGWTNRYQNGAATATLKSGAGTLKSTCYLTPSNGSTLTLYDNTAASGTILALLTPINGSSLLCIDFSGIAFTTGLTMVTVGTGIWQISYR